MSCVIRAVLVAIAISLTACNTVNIKSLPTDATANISALVSEGQSAKRASDALGWGDEITVKQLGAGPGDLKAFTNEVCDPPFFAAFVGAKALQTYNEGVADLAKAPDDSLSAYIRSIRNLDEAIAELKKPHPKKDDEALRSELIAKCTPLVTQDLGLSGGLHPNAFPVVGAADALLKFFAIPAQIAKMIETQKRAEAVKAYIVAHDAELTGALNLLGKNGGLDQAIRAARTYYLRRAFAAYVELAGYRANHNSRPSSPPIDTADVYAQFVVRYLKLQKVSGQALIEDKDGLRAAYSSLAKAAMDPNGDVLTALDAFLLALKNISDLGSAVSDYKKAVDAL